MNQSRPHKGINIVAASHQRLKGIGNWTNPAFQSRKPKSQIGPAHFEISDFGFEMPDSSNFQFPVEGEYLH
jgi:hypothetical protein